MPARRAKYDSTDEPASAAGKSYDDLEWGGSNDAFWEKLLKKLFPELRYYKNIVR